MKRNRKNKIQNKLMSVKFGKQYKKMFKRKKLIHKIIKRINRIKTNQAANGNKKTKKNKLKYGDKKINKVPNKNKTKS